MKMKFIRAKSREDLVKIHRLFFKILNEVKKYYVVETINEEKEIYNESFFLKKYASKNNYAFGLYLDNVLVGFQLMYIEEGVCFLEWTGVSSKFRGKGYGKCIKTSLENFLIHNSNVHKIMADCLVINKESIFNLMNSGFNIVTKLDCHWNKQDYYLWEKFIK